MDNEYNRTYIFTISLLMNMKENMMVHVLTDTYFQLILKYLNIFLP